MFEISDDAMNLILTCLDDALEGRPDLRRGNSIGLRLNFKPGGAHLSLAFPRPSDRVVPIMGRPVLIVDSQDFERLDNVSLTLVQGPRGHALSMVSRNPEPTLQP